MRTELLNEMEDLLEVMKGNLVDNKVIMNKSIDLLKRMRIYELYQEELSQYDYCIEQMIVADL